MAFGLREAAPYLILGLGLAFLAIAAGGGDGEGDGSDTVPAPPGAPPGAPPLEPGESVILVGDSLGVGTALHLGPLLAASGHAFSNVTTVGHSAHQTLIDVLASGAAGDIGFISLGTNDAALFDTATMGPYVTQLVALLRERGARRVLWLVPPNYGITNPPSPATRAKQDTVRALMEAEGVEVIEPSPSIVALLGQDRMHLPPSGYQKMAEAALTAVS